MSASRTRPDRATVVIRNETKNQRGEILQIAIMKTLAFARPK